MPTTIGNLPKKAKKSGFTKKKSLSPAENPTKRNVPAPATHSPEQRSAASVQGTRCATNAMTAAGQYCPKFCPRRSYKNAAPASSSAAKSTGAAVEIRTRDLFLTKEVLYLLSYSSIWSKNSHQRLRRWWESLIKQFSPGMSIQISAWHVIFQRHTRCHRVSKRQRRDRANAWTRQSPPRPQLG